MLFPASLFSSTNSNQFAGRQCYVWIYLVKRQQRERKEGHKIGKMGRHRLWMSPKTI